MQVILPIALFLLGVFIGIKAPEECDHCRQTEQHFIDRLKRINDKVKKDTTHERCFRIGD